jgi:hypothetical protein
MNKIKNKRLQEKVTKLVEDIRNGKDSICKESIRCYFSRKYVVVPKVVLLRYLPELAAQEFKPFVQPLPKEVKVKTRLPIPSIGEQIHSSIDRIELRMESQNTLVREMERELAATKNEITGSKKPIAALRYILMASENAPSQFYFGSKVNLSHSQLSKEFERLHSDGDYWRCIGGGFYTVSVENSRMQETNEVLIWGKSGDYGSPGKDELEKAITYYNSSGNYPIRAIY